MSRPGPAPAYRQVADLRLRVAALLHAHRAELFAQTRGVYERYGFNEDYQERAVALVGGLIDAFASEDDVLLERGDAVGEETLRWFRRRQQRFMVHADALLRARNEIFFGTIPQLLPESLRPGAITSIAAFLTGYVRTISRGDTAMTYEIIGLTVRRLSTARSITEIARVCVDAALLLLDIDAAWYAAREHGTWRMIAERGLSLAGDVVFTDGEIDEIEALKSGETIVRNDVALLSPNTRKRFERLRIGSCIAVPILMEGECVGAFGVGRTVPSVYTPQERAVAEILAAQVSANVRERAASAAMRDAVDALQTELRRKEQIATALQQAFIPKAFPSVPGLAFDAVYAPAEDDAHVGGDWYDVFVLPQGRVAFSVGDVAGHGVDAAVVMGRIRQGIYAASLESVDPAEILRKVNRLVTLQGLGLATAIVGFIDTAAREMLYASAGHPPPAIAGSGGTRFLPSRGIPLGIVEEVEVEVERVPFDDEGFFVFYTDGLIEFERDVTAGQAMLARAIAEAAAGTNRDNLAARIRERTLGVSRATDDVAVLVIRTGAATPALNSVQALPNVFDWDFDSSDSSAAREARQQAMAVLRRQCAQNEDLAYAELILGELIANTVEHAPGPVHVTLDWTEPEPVLRVRDTGRGFQSRGWRLADVWSEGGRGLYLVSQLAKELRVNKRLEGGSEVCAVLPLGRNAEPAI